MSDTIVNCDCTAYADDAQPQETLVELRTRMIKRLGYAARADNPPPGMATFMDEFLISAQRTLYADHKPLHTERFYQWTMIPGIRHYAVEDGNDIECSLQLDAYKVTWVGFEDLQGAWYDLEKGIDPRFYTRVDEQTGYPTHYEIRRCVEIWPAPREAYTLWVKGHIGLASFSADNHKTTIDSELVFLQALGDAKSHYGQRDANNVLAKADRYMKRLIAGKHHTARYIPKPATLRVPAVRPRFLPLEE